MKKMNTKGFVLLIIVLMIVGLFYYVYLNDNAGKSQSVTSSSETEKLLNYDFENDYPKTVRETVKLHNNYLKTTYNGGFSEEELSIVNHNIRQLFDSDLLEYNDEAKQLSGLKNEIQIYQEEKRKIVNFSVAEGSQVQYNNEEGKEYAKIKVTLILKIEGSTVSVDEEYILRQDDEGRWKILGWQAINNASNDTTEDK